MMRTEQSEAFAPIRVDQRLRARRQGLTLIEVVLAMMLAGMVVSVATAVTVQSVRIRRSLESHLSSQWKRADLLDRFELDVDQAVWWLPEETETLKFPREPERLIEIIGLVDAPSTKSMFRRRLPARITYNLEGDPNQPGGKRLVREVVDLTAPEPIPRRSIVADGLEDAAVQGYVNGLWHVLPRDAVREGELLKAVRLVCRWRRAGSVDATRTVLIEDRRGGKR